MRQIKNTNIIIGNYKEACNETLIKDKENNIKVIMTVCEKDPPQYSGIAQFKVKLSDPLSTLAPNNPLHEAVQVFKIAQNLANERKGNIFIHCVSGHNRSAIVPALFLCQTKKYDIQKAVELTKVKDNKPWMQGFGYEWK